MPAAQYRHYGCRVTDDLLYKGMRTLFLENEQVRVGVLLDKGADLFQFIHKPSDTDFLWRSPNGLLRPDRFTPSRPPSSGAFLDAYHGGWQEIFPGGGPVDYRGAELGLHGEVTHLGWEYELITDEPGEVAVRASVNCVRTPYKLERTMRLRSGEPILHIEETLTNLSPEDQEFMWGHHPAFGAPFLREGVQVVVPCEEVEVHSPRFAGSSVLQPGSVFPWPLAPVDGRSLDLSCVQSERAGFAELLYLRGLKAGWYALVDRERSLGIGLSWPVEVFPYLWFWMVYGSAPGYPWWNRAYCIALEPWTSIPNNLDQAILRDTQAHLRGGDSLTVFLNATVITGREPITNIDPLGYIS